jgi:N6-adenosine-specific RNA methylase IME4
VSARYSVIVADCPWSHEDKLRMGGTVGIKRSADSHYDVMPKEHILALPIFSVAAEDCILACWCPATLLHSHGYPAVAAWGFEPKQLFAWVKTTKHGKLAFNMGRYFRNCAEFAIVATRGRPKLLNKGQRAVLLAEQLPHSQKPEGLQDSLEQMYEGPYLELFARRERPGWTCVGDECPSTSGVDIRDWLAAA